MLSLIGVAAAGSTFGGSFVMFFILFFLFSAASALVITNPPKFITKKVQLANRAKKVTATGENLQNLTHLDMVGRLIKHTVKSDNPIRAHETALESHQDIAAEVLGTDNIHEIRKYWPFAPGLTYEQMSDGVSVKVSGDDHVCTVMSSLSYWGFHVNDEVREYAFEKVRETGSGNHGSYLLLGKNTVVDEAYDRMKKFYNRKHCSFAASGFLGCMNLVANLCPAGGVIFMDEKCHVCLRYGSKLTGAKVIKFPHQNYEALAELMKDHRHEYTGRAILVLDAIYSADGTIADLPKAKKLCDQHEVLLVMDEAHSLGSLGKTGHGIEEHFDMVGACDFICGVFSKTLSSYGGYVVSDLPFLVTLTITPGVGFATGPHSFSAATVAKGLEIIERDNGKMRAHIEELKSFYVDELKKNGCVNVVHCGHNVFVSYPHLFAATTVAVEMRKRGYLVSSFMFPSVPLDRSTLRLTVTPLMTKEMLVNFSKTLGDTMAFLSEKRFGDRVMFGRHNPFRDDELHHVKEEADDE